MYQDINVDEKVRFKGIIRKDGLFSLILDISCLK